MNRRRPSPLATPSTPPLASSSTATWTPREGYTRGGLHIRPLATIIQRTSTLFARLRTRLVRKEIPQEATLSDAHLRIFGQFFDEREDRVEHEEMNLCRNLHLPSLNAYTPWDGLPIVLAFKARWGDHEMETARAAASGEGVETRSEPSSRWTIVTGDLSSGTEASAILKLGPQLPDTAVCNGIDRLAHPTLTKEDKLDRLPPGARLARVYLHKEAVFQEFFYLGITASRSQARLGMACVSSKFVRMVVVDDSTIAVESRSAAAIGLTQMADDSRRAPQSAETIFAQRRRISVEELDREDLHYALSEYPNNLHDPLYDSDTQTPTPSPDYGEDVTAKTRFIQFVVAGMVLAAERDPAATSIIPLVSPMATMIDAGPSETGQATEPSRYVEVAADPTGIANAGVACRKYHKKHRNGSTPVRSKRLLRGGPRRDDEGGSGGRGGGGNEGGSGNEEESGEEGGDDSGEPAAKRRAGEAQASGADAPQGGNIPASASQNVDVGRQAKHMTLDGESVDSDKESPAIAGHVSTVDADDADDYEDPDDVVMHRERCLYAYAAACAQPFRIMLVSPEEMDGLVNLVLVGARVEDSSPERVKTPADCPRGMHWEGETGKADRRPMDQGTTRGDEPLR